MALKLNKLDDAFWINVQGTDFLVRPLTLSEENRLRKKHTRTRRGVQQIDQDQLYKDRFDRIVQDWKTIELNGTEDPPCIRENKDWICEHFTSVASDIMERTEEESNETQEVDNENLSK